METCNFDLVQCRHYRKLNRFLSSKDSSLVTTDQIQITVRHGSADTVVRAMNAFNGKCYFSGSDSSETF